MNKLLELSEFSKPGYENPFFKLEVNEEKMLSGDRTENNRNKMFMQVLLD